jgi:hypothetical protein
MSRMLRSPSLRASSGLLSLGVLLWLLLRAPATSPHRDLQAHALVQILAKHLQDPSGFPWREPEHRAALSNNPGSPSILQPPDATLPPPNLFAHTRQRDTQPSVLTVTELAEGAIVTTPLIPMRGTLTVASPITVPEEHHKLSVTARALTATASLQWKCVKGII